MQIARDQHLDASSVIGQVAEQRANAGDESAIEFCTNLWQDYRETGVLCFLCDGEISKTEFPPFAQVIGDLADPNKAISVPLCARCRGFPQMRRWSRCMKTARLLHRAKTGKNSHFVYSPPVQRYGRRR